MANPKPVVITGEMITSREQEEDELMVEIESYDGFISQLFLADGDVEAANKMKGRKVSVTIAIEP